MYSDYSKVQKFFQSAAELLKTSQSMQEIFLAATKHKKERAFTYMNDKGKPVSYKYKHYAKFCFEAGSRLSQILSEIPQNSVVALKVKNCPEWAHIFWGLLMCGYIPFLVDAKLPKENTENLLKQSKAAAIVTNEIFNYSVLTVNALNINETKVNYRFAEKWANRIIFCSSGTTGNVKLMVYNGSNICAQIAACLEMPEYTPDIMYPGEVNILALVPFHHIFGFVAVFLWYTFFGKNIVYVRDLSPTEVMNTSRKCNVTHVYSVPLFWDSLAQSLLRRVDMEGDKKSEVVNKMIAFNTKKISSDEAGVGASRIAQQKVQDMLLGHKIRFCISGGGAISPETLNTINGIGYPLYNGYGMTEAGVTSVELAQRVEYRLKGSIGRPFHGVEYKLLDRQKLHKNIGELAIKSPITHIYEIIDGVEQEAQLEDGWLRTGDIASVDETGFYYLKGRIKDVIINANGENIYPDEVEDYFKDIPGITKLCVVGNKKGKSSHETITCIVELSNDVDDEKLKQTKLELDRINMTLSNEKRVQEFLIAKDKLPLTSSMKVKRFQVKELLKIKKGAFISFDAKKEIKHFDGFDMKDVEPVVKKMRSIFAKILFLPTVRIGDDDHWIDELGGDSMSYVELINAVNNEMNVQIPEELYAKLTCVNDFAEEVLILRGAKKNK